jgi:hypothetical protein
MTGPSKKYDPGGVANAFATAVGKKLKAPHERESVLCLNFSKLGQEAAGNKRSKAKSQQTVDSSMESCSLSSCSGPKIDRNAKSPEIVVDALKKQAASFRVADLNSYFRSVFEVGDDGAVKKNSYSNLEAPASETRTLVLGDKHKAFTPAAFIEARTRARLSEEMEKVGEYSVHKNQKADWQRMEISFATGDGKLVETKDFRTDDQDFREKEILDEISAFAGSDQAITVLSAVLVQIDLPVIYLSHPAGGDEYVQFDPPSAAPGYATFFVSGGAAEKMESVQNFGTSEIAVSKDDNGDFVVDVTGYMLTPGAVRVTGDGQETAITSRLCVSPSNPKSHSNKGKATGEVRTQQCLRIDLNARLIISGAAARNGEIEIDPNSQVTKSYSGSFAMPQ